jgi:membrane-bound lytic murein transglycosylase D
VDSILRENKLPNSFGFLPLVLSGYNSTHTSDFSSKGIWALSYITALKKDLQINSYIDQRMNNRLATLAAVQQLKFLMGNYKNENWTLLAFITSPSYVSNIFKESKSKKWDVAQEFIESKYLQNIKLINWLNQLDLKDFIINNKTSDKNYQKFSFNDNILFDAIAQFKIIDFNQINIKNPFLTGQMIPKNQSIVLKKELGNFILQNQFKIIAFQDSMINNLFLKEASAKEPLIHIIEFGDVLGQIAIDYDVSVAQIMKWNNLSSTMIYQGQKLKLFSNQMDTNYKIHLYTVSKEKYFWEVASNRPETSVKKICKYNIYQELKQNQQLKITNK